MPISPEYSQFALKLVPVHKKDDPQYFTHAGKIQDPKYHGMHRIVTVYHAIENQKVLVQYFQEKTGNPQLPETITFHRFGLTDIAISEPIEGAGLPFAPFPSPGQEVVIATYNNGRLTLRPCTVTNRFEIVQNPTYKTLLSIITVNDPNKPIHPGMSGGLVVNEDNQVVAIVRGYPGEKSNGIDTTVEQIGNIFSLQAQQSVKEKQSS